VPANAAAGLRLRVVVTTESYLPYLSGVTVSVEALVRGLSARGHQVMLVAPRPRVGVEPGSTGAVGPDPEYAWLPSYEVPRLVPPSYRMPWPVDVRGVLRRAASFRPDVVHAQSPFVSGLFARSVARRAGAPLVFTHHTRFTDYRHYLSIFAGVGGAVMGRYLDRFALACDAVIAPSTDMAFDIRERLGDVPDPQIRVVPTGIDVERLAGLEPIDSRPGQGWPADTVVAVTAGRLAPEKSVETLLEGFAKALAREPRLRLVVIGDGHSGRALRARAAEPDLAGRVAFMGQRPRLDTLAIVKACDVFLFASQTETQGLVLAESLACGVPVVAVAAPGVSDTVTDGVDGRIVAAEPAARRSAAIADALLGLARDPQRRVAMARAGRDGAHRFGVDHRLAQVESVYREAIVRRPS
jgi:1,2-diacylglycerol 3-alpha-glucosyltransferase